MRDHAALSDLDLVLVTAPDRRFAFLSEKISGRQNDATVSVTPRQAIVRAVLWGRPRSPRAEAGPLKGSPVSVRLRPGVLFGDHALPSIDQCCTRRNSGLKDQLSAKPPWFVYLYTGELYGDKSGHFAFRPRVAAPG